MQEYIHEYNSCYLRREDDRYFSLNIFMYGSIFEEYSVQPTQKMF